MQIDIQGLLDKDETIIWSGQPDLSAIKKTRRKGNGLFFKLAGGVFLIAFIWVISDSSNVWTTGSAMTWVWVVAIAGALWLVYSRLYASPKKLKCWVTSLTYAITDKRILILKGEQIEQAFTLSDVLQTQISERKGAPGFKDLIWEKRAIERRTSSGNVRYVSPLECEQAETGFKALADADSVKHILDSWINTQKNALQQVDDNFISSQSADTVNEVIDDSVKSSNSILYASPLYGFSIDFPASWDITSRYRKLAFGKWGIEREAVWSTPDNKPKWNVIRGQNETNTHVELQVQKIAPFNNPKSLMSSTASLLGAGEVIDSNPDISINGIPGFYVTRHCGSAGSILPSQIKDMLSYWYMRQYILHDGQYQYYIEAMWPAEDDGQREVCETVIATLLPSQR